MLGVRNCGITRGEPSSDTGCSPFVGEKATACHSESAAADKESPHLKAQSVQKDERMNSSANNRRVTSV